jgi:hypothetical protein
MATAKPWKGLVYRRPRLGSLTRLLRKTRHSVLSRPSFGGAINPDFSYAPILSNPGPLGPDDRLIFLHIEKTAGTTAHHILAQHFTEDQICPERFGDMTYWNEGNFAPYRYFSMHASLRMLNPIPQPRKIVTFLREPVARLLSHYNFWRSMRDDFVARENLDYIRYVKALDLKTLLSPQSLAILPQFWNIYTQRLAGDLHISPSGKPWRDELEVLETALENLSNVTALGLTEYPKLSFQRIAEDLAIPNRYDGIRLNDSSTLADAAPDAFEKSDPGPLDDETMDCLARATGLDRHVYDAASRLFRDRLRLGITFENIIPAHLRTEWIDGREAAISDDRGGAMLYGPYCTLPPGRYRVALRARASANRVRQATSRVELDVCSDFGNRIHARRTIRPADLPTEGFEPMEIEFILAERTSDLEFRLLCSGQPGLTVSRGINIRRL